MPDRNGFSLIELLIVVAIILIIAAIAIPNLMRARIAANESSAAASVRTIVGGEIAYNSAYPEVGYPADLTSLGAMAPGCAPSSTQACIIDGQLASGDKSGYTFTATGSDPAGTANTTYLVVGWPQTVNGSGVKGFCAVEDNVVRFQNPYSAIPDHTTCVALPSIGN